MFGILLFFIVGATALLVFITVMIVLARKWDLIKFWLFLKFGIQFKDKTEMVENLAEIDYDAFINYK